MRTGLRFDAGPVASAVSVLTAQAIEVSEITATGVAGSAGRGAVAAVFEEFADATGRAARGMGDHIDDTVAAARDAGEQLAATDRRLSADAHHTAAAE